MPAPRAEPLPYGDGVLRSAASPSDSAARGNYVYCIIRSGKPLQFGLSTIAGDVGGVDTVNYRDLAAVVSDMPIGPLDSIRENVLAHEHVNEMVMREHTVIPMSFGTIFTTREAPSSVVPMKLFIPAPAAVDGNARSRLLMTSTSISGLWEGSSRVRTLNLEPSSIEGLG